MEIDFLYNFNLVTEDLDSPLVNQGWLSMATCLLRGFTKGKLFWKTDLMFDINSWLADSVSEDLRISSQVTSLINLTKRSLFLIVNNLNLESELVFGRSVFIVDEKWYMG